MIAYTFFCYQQIRKSTTSTTERKQLTNNELENSSSPLLCVSVKEESSTSSVHNISEICVFIIKWRIIFLCPQIDVS